MRALILTIWRFLFYKLTHVSEEKWRILAICLTLSGTLWFLRQMNKTYTTGMKVRVSFEYDKRRYLPVDPLPDALWLNVTAQGWPLALAAYGPGRSQLVIRPALDKGFWEANPIEIRKRLQPRLRRVAINYLQDAPTAYRFDSIIQRQMPVEVKLPNGRKGFGSVCFKGPSLSYLRLPQQHVLSQEPSDSTVFTLPVSELYETKWKPFLCQDSITIRM